MWISSDPCGRRLGHRGQVGSSLMGCTGSCLCSGPDITDLAGGSDCQVMKQTLLHMIVNFYTFSYVRKLLLGLEQLLSLESLFTEIVLFKTPLRMSCSLLISQCIFPTPLVCLPTQPGGVSP